MITARVYMNPFSKTVNVDMYLGNRKEQPILIHELGKGILSYDSATESFVMKIDDRESTSLIRFDRLYIQDDLDTSIIMTSQEIADNPEIMKRIKSMRLVSD